MSHWVRAVAQLTLCYFPENDACVPWRTNMITITSTISILKARLGAYIICNF